MEFVKKIQEYIIQGETIKNKYPHIWTEDYNEIVEELKNISDTAKIDSDNALMLFSKLHISKYKSFGDYIKSIDINASKLKFQTIIKAKQKKLICRHCSSTQIYKSKEGIYVCKKCGSEIENKSNTQLLAKETVDTSKHIVKQLNTLTGRVHIPSTLVKVMPYLTTWFLDRSYIYNYLKYVNKVSSWIKKYYKLSKIVIEESYFLQEVKRDKSSLVSYKIFKLYTDTFYEMTNLVKTYNCFNNNISILKEKEILEICQSYFNIYNKIPLENEIFEYNGIKYEIGKYIISQMIQDINSETKFKQNLNKIFKTEIKMPGLMFDYVKIYNSNNIPKKFAYQQNFIYIVHSIYNIPYHNILESDKQIITDIMVLFNEYVKKVKTIETGKNHNSCLWQISLLYVFDLPWFKCYKPMTELLPIKQSNTTIIIGELWAKFKIINHEYISKFTTKVRKEIEEEKINTKVTVNNTIDKQAVLDFINKTGNNYGGDNDRYLRDKMNVVEAKHDWVNNINMMYVSDLNTKDDDLNEDSEDNLEDNLEDNYEYKSDNFEDNYEYKFEDDIKDDSEEYSNEVYKDDSDDYSELSSRFYSDD